MSFPTHDAQVQSVIISQAQAEAAKRADTERVLASAEYRELHHQSEKYRRLDEEKLMKQSEKLKEQEALINSLRKQAQPSAHYTDSKRKRRNSVDVEQQPPTKTTTTPQAISFADLVKAPRAKDDRNTVLTYWNLNMEHSIEEFIDYLIRNGLTFDKNPYWKVKKDALDHLYAIRLQTRDIPLISLHITEINSLYAFTTSEKLKSAINDNFFVLQIFKVPHNITPDDILEDLSRFEAHHVTWKIESLKSHTYTAYVAVAKLASAAKLHNVRNVMIKKIPMSASLLHSNYLRDGNMWLEGRNPPSIEREIDAMLVSEFLKYGVVIKFWFVAKTPRGEFENKIWVSAESNKAAAEKLVRGNWNYKGGKMSWTYKAYDEPASDDSDGSDDDGNHRMQQ